MDRARGAILPLEPFDALTSAACTVEVPDSSHVTRRLSVAVRLVTELLKTRIIPQRIEHGIEPEQHGRERHAFSQRAIDVIQCVLATDCYRK
jgi:hypothetical protein